MRTCFFIGTSFYVNRGTILLEMTNTKKKRKIRLVPLLLICAAIVTGLAGVFFIFNRHEIVIEPGAGPVLSEKEQKKEIEAAIRWQEEMQASGQKAESSKPPKAKQATSYEIDNVIHTAVEVSRKE